MIISFYEINLFWVQYTNFKLAFTRVKFGVKMNAFIHLNLPLESLYLLKKPHQNPWHSFKDLNIHKDRPIGIDLVSLVR